MRAAGATAAQGGALGNKARCRAGSCLWRAALRRLLSLHFHSAAMSYPDSLNSVAPPPGQSAPGQPLPPHIDAKKKLVVVGDGGAGKTSLLIVYVSAACGAAAVGRCLQWWRAAARRQVSSGDVLADRQRKSSRSGSGSASGSARLPHWAKRRSHSACAGRYRERSPASGVCLDKERTCPCTCRVAAAAVLTPASVGEPLPRSIHPHR